MVDIEKVFIDGPVGKLESEIIIPEAKNPNFKNDVIIICHPHPLHDGTMQNKVVTTIAKAFANANIPSVRFNFRGVGKSEGVFGNYIGEVQDCIAVVNYVNDKFNKPNIWLAGFSFGAYVAAKVSTQYPVSNLIMVAPAVHHNSDYKYLSLNCPVLVIQGDEDEIVPVAEVYSWFDKLILNGKFNKTLVKIPNASHFFHSKLIDLRNSITKHFSLS